MMRLPPFTYWAPESAEEVVQILAGEGPAAAGDRVLLKGGAEVAGTVLKESPEHVVVDLGFGVVAIPRTHVRAVRKAVAAADPPARVVDAVVDCGKECDLIVMGATEEPLFRNLLIGRLPERIARQADVTVVMVKRRSGALKSWVRQTILEPTVPKPL